MAIERLVTDSDDQYGPVDQLLVDTSDVTHAYIQFLQEHNPEDVDTYLRAKDAEIFTGKPVWKRRNFDGTVGITYDLYVRQNHFASIDEEDGYVVALIMPPQTNGSPVVLDTFDHVSKEKNVVEAIARIEALLPEED